MKDHHEYLCDKLFKSIVLNPDHKLKVARYSFLKKMEIYDLDPYFWKIITCLKIKSTFAM